MRAESLTESREWLSRALALDPENVLALSTLGQVEAESGRTREALEISRRAVALVPANAQAHAYLGERYIELGFYESALSEFARAMDLDPLYVNAYGMTMQYAAKLSRWDEARKAESRFEELFPDNPLLGWFRGEARYRASDLEGAAAAWRDAGTRPEFQSAARVAGALLSGRKGNPAPARAVLEELRDSDVRYLDHLVDLAALVREPRLFVSMVEENLRCRNYRWLVINPNLDGIMRDPVVVELAQSLYARWQEDVRHLGPSLPVPPAELPAPAALARNASESP